LTNSSNRTANQEGLDSPCNTKLLNCIKPTTQQKEKQHQPFGNGNGLNAGGKFGSNGISG